MSRFMRGSALLEGGDTTPGCHLTEEEKRVFNDTLGKCKDYGLTFYPTIIQKVRYDEMSEIAAYGGFPHRYPHWYWGMQYEELQRGYEYNQHRIYELVINSNPCVMYLLASNTMVDNVTVVAHATGHNDFFFNNIFFTPTDENMMNKLASNGTRIRKYIARWGRERVTEFIDHVLRIQTLIDPAKAWTQREIKEPVIKDKRDYDFPRRLKVDPDRLHMDPWINPKEFIDDEYKRIEERELAKELELFQISEKDIFGFLKDYAHLKPWQQDIISMLYEESMYFSPQRATKTLNEGWACGTSNMLVYTDNGFVTLGEIVNKNLKLSVIDSDGLKRSVTNWFKFENRDVYRVITKRGYKFEGSNNHKILNNHGNWIELENIVNGDEVNLSKYVNLWTNDLYKIHWKQTRILNTLSCIAKKHNLKESLVYSRSKLLSEIAKDDIRLYEKECNLMTKMQNSRKQITIPQLVNEDFASFLGYMIGDGHISDKKRVLGLTSGDRECVDHYIQLVKGLFNLEVKVRWDASSKNGRWRCNVYSKNLRDLLVHLGLSTGVSARIKKIPDCVLKSPKNIVSAFLRAYFDCDACASKENGIILSTSSIEMAEQLQIVLLNYGILSSKYKKEKDNWHIWISGNSAKIYFKEIAFRLDRKQDNLEFYVNGTDFREQEFIDEIVVVEYIGKDTVYDITVDESHCYAAQGFINHNSFIDYELMTRQGLVSMGQKTHDMGIVEYAVHKMGVLGGKYSVNPYKTGFYLLLDIEERWNRGQFGTEWEECKNMQQKEDWDLKLGLGKKKLFEVRKYYNDVTFINEFFTQEFCNKFEYFDYKHYPNGEWRIESRDARVIKRRLLQKHINGGLPDIRIVDPNHRNKGYLLLQHYPNEFDDRVLYDPYARAVLTSIYYLWGREVMLATEDKNGDEYVYACVGTNSEKDVALVTREDYEKTWV